jgi:hypothetical protein
MSQLARIENVENILVGTVDKDGKSHEGLVAKVARIEWMGRLGLIPLVIVTAKALGIPTEVLLPFAKSLLTIIFGVSF